MFYSKLGTFPAASRNNKLLLEFCIILAIIRFSSCVSGRILHFLVVNTTITAAVCEHSLQDYILILRLHNTLMYDR